MSCLLVCRRVASMRPGRIRPGKTYTQGKSRPPSRASMRPGRIRPGKPLVVATAQPLVLRASMRPGRIRPGKPSCATIREAAGRSGFNEAGADPPRKGRARRLAATRGRHRFNEAGADPPRKVHRERGSNDPQARASMRPGRIRPGKSIAPVARRGLMGASMRPGRIRPGKLPPANFMNNKALRTRLRPLDFEDVVRLAGVHAHQVFK